MRPLDLMRRYRELLRAYGPQGWWPMYEFQISNLRFPNERTLIRRSSPKRLSDADRFQICVGAILTQNTAWTNVERAFASIIAHNAVSPSAFAAMPRQRLARMIRPTGYFNQKARKLQVFSRWLVHEHNGSLKQFFRLATHDCRLQLLSLWGIGPETADSMLLYAGRHPVFVVDAYTTRWLEQFRIRFRSYDEYQRFFMDRLPHDAQCFNEFHALIVAWGKTNRRGVRT